MCTSPGERQDMTRFHRQILTISLLTSTFFASPAWSLGKKAPSPAPAPAPAPKPTPTPTPTPNPDDKYSYVDPSGIIPSIPKQNALKLYDARKANLDNINYLTIIDFSQYSGKKRFYIIDMRSGEVETHKTSHGSGGDSDHDGYVNSFSNVSGSNATSLGLYETAETYSGKHGYSLRLDGLSSTNSNARARAIVIHPADYVNDDNTSKSGRSWGCPALDPTESKRIIDKIRGGSLIYAWSK